MSDQSMRCIKCVLVGDAAVGKTSLFASFRAANQFPTGEYIPTMIDHSSSRMFYKSQKVNLTLWDTSGEANYERLRALMYPDTDVFVVCFAVDNAESFESVELKWMPELRKHCPERPVVLVGTKRDKREADDSKKCVKIKKALHVMEKIGAVDYIGFFDYNSTIPSLRYEKRLKDRIKYESLSPFLES